jgi:hypothetical protein
MKSKILIKVDNCNNCPFRNYNYDDFAMGDPETHSCNILQKEWLSNMMKNNIVTSINYFINFYKNGNVKSKNKRTLDNCPLLTENLNIELDEK